MAKVANPKIAALAAILSIFGSVPANACGNSAVTASATHVEEAAMRQLDAAIAAHNPSTGGLRATLTYKGTAPAATQSYTSHGPFELFQTVRTLAIDEPNDRSEITISSKIAGFDFERRLLSSAGNSTDWDLISGESYSGPPPTGILQTYLPHVRLADIRKRAKSLTIMSAPNDPEIRVAFALENGVKGALLIDRSTNYLSAVENEPTQGLFGEEQRTTRYFGFRKISGYVVPAEVRTKIGNPVLGPQESVTRLVSFGSTIDEHSFRHLAAGRPADLSWRKPALAVDVLAPKVYLINNVTDSKDQWSYNVLAVEFDDFVMIAEAPISESVTDRITQKVSELTGNKPVRFVVLTHHHGDHISGVPAYLKDSATAIVTDETAMLLRSIHEANAQAFPKPKLKIIDVDYTLKDKTNEAHIYNIGTTPHAKQMLVVYLPQHGILYQADLLNAKEYTPNENTAVLATWVKHRALNVKLISGLHGATVDANQLEPVQN